MKQSGFSGKWLVGKNAINVNVPVMAFKESEYFQYAINKNTLIADLKAHGWTIKTKTKPFIAPEITDLINKNGYLHDIVNTRPYKMDRMDLPMPQYSSL